jgi:hypothetical protein
MAPPLQKGLRLFVNLLTMLYSTILICAPDSLKSQETNFIDNHLKGGIFIENTRCFVTGRREYHPTLKKSR